MFGYNQFSRTGRYKLSDNEKFLGGNFAPFIPAISGTGAGTTSVSPGNGYTYQTYTASGTLVVSQDITADILIVAGGGAGGGDTQPSTTGGGGGAGGLIFLPNYPLPADTYSIVIGAGGAGYTSSQRGENSYILTSAGSTFALAIGGGNGFASPNTPNPTLYPTRSAVPGGSGGGAGPVPGSNNGGDALQPTEPGISGTYGFGNDGGTHSLSSNPRAGGGGAGAAGGAGGLPSASDFNARSGGPGGIGKQYLDFTGPQIGVPALSPFNGYFSGGGGGVGWYNPNSGGNGIGGAGGLGGGGNGAGVAYSPAGTVQSASTAASANTGGGGGGTHVPGYNATGPFTGSGNWGTFQGGSGIVVVRYQIAP